MNIRGKYVPRLLAASIAFACSVSVGASTITPADPQSANFVPASSSLGDMLYIAAPNDAGISYNKFTNFSVDTPIKLVNTPNYDPVTGDAISSASKIVIVADNINLQSSIELIGPAADIVFLTDNVDGSVNCDGCTINNALRLALIAAESSLSAASNDIGEIETFSQCNNSFTANTGHVSINNLYAPGLLALDIVGLDVSTSGNIDINQPAMSNINGGFSAVEHGNHSIGTGSIDVTLGPVTWSYENDQILGHGCIRTETETLAGNFSAPRVKISSRTGMRFDGSIDTQTDAIAGVSYNGQTHIPQEGIELQTLNRGYYNSASSIFLSGNLNSSNNIVLRARGNLDLDAFSSIESPGVQLIAEDRVDVDNLATITGGNIAVAGGSVINEGELLASGQIQVWAENQIANQYGGLIRARDVVLESENHLVRNGSRTPYRYSSDDYLDLESSELLTDYFNNIHADSYLFNSAELGSFYMVPEGVSTSGGAQIAVVDNSAHIVGEDVSIYARAFENINPYYKRVNEQDEILLARERVGQVSVSAENMLQVRGPRIDRNSTEFLPADYVINSSALMTLNSPTGLLSVDSQKFINERYRIATYLVSSSQVETYTGELFLDMFPTGGTTESTSYASMTAVYSPPGFVASMGNAQFDTPDYFANIMGYIEVFGQADVEAAYLKNFGLANQSIESRHTSTLSIGFSYYTGLTSTTVESEETILHSPQDLDSLFHVSGALRASSADAWFETLNPFHYFVAQTANAIKYRDYQHLDSYFEETIVDCPCEQNGWKYQTFSIGSDVVIDVEETLGLIDQDILVVDWTQDIKTEINRYDGNGEEDIYSTRTGTSQEYSFWDELTSYYESVKHKFSQLFNEFDWWGLAG